MYKITLRNTVYKTRLLFLFFCLFHTSSAIAQNVAVSSTVHSACVPFSVTFTDISTGNPIPSARRWTIPRTSFLTNPTAPTQSTSIDSAGTYYVYLTDSFANGYVHTVIDTIYARPFPVATFDVDSTGCTGAPLHCFDRSTTESGFINHWEWYADNAFRDSVNQNPSFTINTTGLHSVALIVRNNFGCPSSSLKKSVFFYTPPIPDFTFSPNTSCTDFLTVNFTNTTPAVNNYSYLWKFGNGNTSQQITPTTQLYNSPGSYSITLTASVSGHCADSMIKTLEFGSYHASIHLSADTACINTGVNFQASSNFPALSYQWNFGDNSPLVTGTTPSHTYTTAGDFIITLVATSRNTCVDTLKDTIHVNSGAHFPPFSIVAPNIACVNSSISILDSFTIQPSSVIWDFGDNTLWGNSNPQTHLYNNPGNYGITLIAMDNRGCTDTLKDSIVIIPGPNINFIADKSNGCDTPFKVSFHYVQPIAPNLSYSWDFGDGTFGNFDDTNHLYQSFGRFIVILVVTDTITGCRSQQIKDTIYIIKPKLDFAINPRIGCKPLQPTFYVHINHVNVPVLYYQIDYGDGNKDTIPNPTTPDFSIQHKYTFSGAFSATVTVITSECVFELGPLLISVSDTCIDDGSGGNGGGSGGFIVLRNCIDKFTLQFKDTVSNSIVLSWDFGDSTPLDTTHPIDTVTHTYLLPQTSYLVTIVRKDTLSGTISTSNKLVIITNEHVSFNTTDTLLCKNSPARFFTSNGFDSSKIKKYQWFWGDNSSPTTIDNLSFFNSHGVYSTGGALHVYTDTGTYYVSLVVQDKAGCYDTIQSSVRIVVRSPISNFGYVVDSTCLPTIHVHFYDSSLQTGNIPITTWLWEFGNGNTISSNADTVVQEVYSPGNYNTSLKITDSMGCTASHFLPLRVVQSSTTLRALFSVSPSKTCSDSLSVLISDSSRTNGTTPLSIWEWTINDYLNSGTVTKLTGSPFTYNFTSNHASFFSSSTISLKVTDSFGCINVSQPIHINFYHPKAKFVSFDTLICGSSRVDFINQSLVHGNNPDKFTWYYGDGTFGSAPFHLYPIDGIYTIKLVVKDENECLDSTERVDYIKLVHPIANFTTDSIGCTPTTAHFYDSSLYEGNNPGYNWHFSSDNSNSTQQNPQHVYLSPTYDTVTFILTGISGCKDTVTKYFYIKGISGQLFISGQSSCLPDTIQMNIVGENIDKYHWFFNDGVDSFTTVPNSSVKHVYPHLGYFLPSAQILSPEGCILALFPPEKIYVDSADAKFLVDKNFFCGPGTVIISNRCFTASFSALSYKWDFGDGSPIDTTANPDPHLYNRPGTYSIVLAIYSKYGCISSARQTITIYEAPALKHINDTTVCYGESPRFIINATPNTSLIYTINGGTNNLIDIDSLGHGIITTQNLDSSAVYKFLSIAYNRLDSCAIPLSDSFLVKVLPPLSATISGTQSVCQGSNNQISIAGNPNSIVSYAINGVSNQVQINSSGTSGITINNIIATTICKLSSIRYNGSLMCSKPLSDSIIIKPLALPAASISGDTAVCSGASTNIIITGTPLSNVFYHTNRSASQQINIGITGTISLPTGGLTTGITYYIDSILYAVNPGCPQAIFDSSVISVNPNPTITSTGDTTICRNTSVQLFASGGTSYSWSPGATLNNPNIANPTASPADVNRKYVVTVTSANNCSSKDSFTVKVTPVRVYSISGNQSVCLKIKSQLNASGGNYYSWYPASLVSNPHISNPLVTATSSTLYSVLIKDTVCGTDTILTTNITILPLPTITAKKQNDITCAVGESKLFASGALKYEWYPAFTLDDANSASPIAKPASTTTYFVNGTGANGCSDTASVIVFVDNTIEASYNAPNAFTPNGDGLNDCYRIKYWGVIRELRFMIYNRWGERVFYSTDENDCWDGYFKGNPSDPGNFVYHIKAITNCGVVERKGNLVLIR